MVKNYRQWHILSVSLQLVIKIVHPQSCWQKYFLKFIELALSGKFSKKLLLSIVGFWFFSPREVSVFHERACPIWIKLMLPLPAGSDGESLCSCCSYPPEGCGQVQSC